MATDNRRAPASSPSLPPVSHTGDMAWDDDATREDRDSSADRVTAIPELPPEVLAKQLMAEAVEEPTLRTHGKLPTFASGSGLPSTAPRPGKEAPSSSSAGSTSMKRPSTRRSQREAVGSAPRQAPCRSSHPNPSNST